MELTPIRIRGRRKRNRQSENQDASRKRSARPWKAVRFNHASLQALQNKKPRPKDPNLSYFEQLPTELVQVIFESCNNINLPLSSFVFARKLSHRNIYLRFAIDTLAVDAATEKVSDAAAVSRMLQCKWMSWEIFKDAVQELHRRRLPPRRASSPSTTDSEDDDENNTEQQNDPDIPVPNFETPEEQPRLPYLSLDRHVQIPQSLLRGPWTPSKLSFLRYLIWSGARIDWSSSSRGEIATQGLETALSTRNHTAVALLCSAPINVVPDTTTLRQAVMDYNCDTSCVFHLLVAAVRAHIVARVEGQPPPDVGFRDAPLWSWAARIERAGNEKGKWLKEALRFAGDMSSRSVWDEETFAEFKRVSGREQDGVREVVVPVVDIDIA